MGSPSNLCSLDALVAGMMTALCFAVPVQGQTRSAWASTAMSVSATRVKFPQQTSGEVTTIHAYSNLVVVDVVVSDARGNPIHGLKSSDFSLRENNQEQPIRNFEEHGATPALVVKTLPAPRLPPGLFSNKPPAPENGPANVLLLDYLNTPLASQPYARKQLLEFLDKTPAGTRIAIFALTEQLFMLKGFTADMASLKAALTSNKGAPQASGVLLNSVNGGPMKDRSLDALKEGASQAQIDDLNRMEAQQTSFTQDLRAKYTLNGFDELARYLAGISGRKNVIWFSAGFPLNIEPSIYESDPNDSVVRNDEEVRKTDNLLTRAQIAVYPVDARGIQGDPGLNLTLDIDKTRAAAAAGTARALNGSPAASESAASLAESSVMASLQDTAQEHESMLAMAEDTGGEAFVNTNGLAQSVGKAIENGSNYYTLTYTPTNAEWDGRFRTIKVRVDRRGVKLSYRNGYYAVDPGDRNKLQAQGAATAITQSSAMAAAMIHGSPEPSEILFKVRIRPANAGTDETVLKSNETNPDLKVKSEGPYKEYGIDLVPDAHAVDCWAEASGNRHCAIEVWTFVYDAEGEKIVTASNRLRTLLTPAEYNKLLSGGMAFHQQVSVPLKGEYYLRTGIHDLVSDKVGTVEVPVSAIATLDPLKQFTDMLAPMSEGTSMSPTTTPRSEPRIP